MTEKNLTSRVLNTVLRAGIATAALYTVSCLGVGREAVRDIGYSNPACSQAAYIVDRHIYGKPDLITLAAILGTAISLRKTIRGNKNGNRAE